jgi:hypothetical protein
VTFDTADTACIRERGVNEFSSEPESVRDVFALATSVARVAVGVDGN